MSTPRSQKITWFHLLPGKLKLRIRMTLKMCQCQDSLFHFPLIITYLEFKEKPGRVGYRSCETFVKIKKISKIENIQILFLHFKFSRILSAKKGFLKEGQVIFLQQGLKQPEKSMCEVQRATLEEVYGTSLNTCQVMYLTKYNRGFPNGRQPFMSKRKNFS